MKYEKPRGTVDLFGHQANSFEHVQNILSNISRSFGFEYVISPIFESAELFKKSVGNESDIVQKEFYDFYDKSKRHLVLRPEGTAGTIRAIVNSKKLVQNNYPYKCFYYGPMFRYERPQLGRQRQFNQFGVECVGNFSYQQEVEIISLGKMILDQLRINKYRLEINNLGTPITRRKWIEALTIYFADYKKNNWDLSETSISRIYKNPLRILDDKIDGQKDFVKNAPKLDLFLTLEDKTNFKKIKDLLEILKIDYKINNYLVRGLDYYNGLVFEFIVKINNQDLTVIGGGKYNSLVAEIGGPDLPGIGFGLGIERLIIILNELNPSFLKEQIIEIMLAPLTFEAQNESAKIINNLRKNYIPAIVNYDSLTLKKHFKFAEFLKVKYIGIIGLEEINSKTIKVKNQLTKTEETINLSELIKYLGK